MIVGRGTLLAHLFENSSAGVPRNVYWGLYLGELQGTEAGEFESIGCDWLTFPVRRFGELSNHSLDSCLLPDLVECSVYQDAEHHWAQLETLAFEASTGDGELTVHMALRPSNIEPAIAKPIQVQCVVQFEGLVVVPQSFEPNPRTPEDVASIAVPYVDLEDLEPPVWDRFRFVLKPKLK